jgi:hypothetical protein
MVLLDQGQLGVCSQVNSVHGAGWCTAWRSVFVVKTLYQTISFVTVQRQFQRKFNRQQVLARCAISHLVQKYGLPGSVCNKKKGVVGRHRSACVQDSVSCV